MLVFMMEVSTDVKWSKILINLLLVSTLLKFLVWNIKLLQVKYNQAQVELGKLQQ